MTIIFDFDGTIADSFEVIISIFQHLTKNHTKLSEEDMHRLRQQPLLTVAKQLHVPAWKIPYLVFRGRLLMRSRMSQVVIFEGMGKVIDQLHAEGHELFILSSNSSGNVKTFLHEHHLNSRFVDIRGNVSLLGKARALRKLLHRNSLNIDDTWYVGDESRDIEASKSVGLRCIAVTWGFADLAALEPLKPTALAHEPKEIVDILNS